MFARLSAMTVVINTEGVALDFLPQEAEEPTTIELSHEDASALRESLNKTIGYWKGSYGLVEEVVVEVNTQYKPRKPKEYTDNEAQPEGERG